MRIFLTLYFCLFWLSFNEWQPKYKQLIELDYSIFLKRKMGLKDTDTLAGNKAHLFWINKYKNTKYGKQRI